MEIPDSVTQIGSEAFSECKSLQSVVIPQGVSEIGYAAFRGCISLQSVVIPQGVTEIGDCAFYECSSLQSVVIPEGVTEIRSEAFRGCISLQSVVVPQGVTEIGRCAFYECSSLQSAEIPQGVTEIGDWAFSDCSSLQSVVIPEGVSINYGMFEGTPFLKKIPGDLQILNQQVLRYRGNASEVVIPQGVTQIGDRAFYECSSLQSMVIPQEVTQIGNFAFCGCSRLQSVVIPQGVTQIGNLAFCGCSSLQSVVIPEGVTQIGEDAFSGCSSLQSVEIPDSVTQIGDYAFYECGSLQSVVIPQGVTWIGKSAFSDCCSLRSVVITQGVTQIGENAFYGCSSLQSVMIPEGMSINCEMFEDTPFLENIPGDLRIWNQQVLRNSGTASEIVIPVGVTRIGDHAFYFYHSLQSVVIPQGVTEIGIRAFYGCSSLQSVVIPQGMTQIGNFAFSKCESLQSVVIPDGVSINRGRFEGTPFLENIPGDLQIWNQQVLRYRGNASEVVIPQGVKEIGDGAFSNCSSLQSVLIPEGVTEIGEWAFDLGQKISYPFSQKVVFQLPRGIQTVGHNFARGCVAEVTLWQGEGTTVESKYGFSDVYLQIVDTAGMFLCRVYIPAEITRGDEYDEENYQLYPSAYGYWATRLLLGGVQSISEYDTFFERYPDHLENPNQVLYDKALIALCRLRFPYELSERYKLAYEQYLIQHARLTIQKLAKDNNLEMLTFLLEMVTIPLKKYIDMVDWSAKAQKVEITGMLLEYRHRTWGETIQSYSLDDVELDADEDELESDDDNDPY